MRFHRNQKPQPHRVTTLGLHMQLMRENWVNECSAHSLEAMFALFARTNTVRGLQFLSPVPDSSPSPGLSSIALLLSDLACSYFAKKDWKELYKFNKKKVNQKCALNSLCLAFDFRAGLRDTDRCSCRHWRQVKSWQPTEPKLTAPDTAMTIARKKGQTNTDEIEVQPRIWFPQPTKIYFFLFFSLSVLPCFVAHSAAAGQRQQQ